MTVTRPALPSKRLALGLTVVACVALLVFLLNGNESFKGVHTAFQNLYARIFTGTEKDEGAKENPKTSVPEVYDEQKIVNYYAFKYRRNPDYLTEIIRYAFTAAQENEVSPFILLAIISHESNFLSAARNSSGAEGLMQIMTPVHKKRFEIYGGIQTAFIPEINIRVGASILRECIGIMKSVKGGLRCYAGTVNSDDGGFVDYVLNEANMMKKMALRKETTPPAGNP